MSGDQVLEDSGWNADLGSDCVVTEGTFPCQGKCYVRNDFLSSDLYKKNCPHCRIWTSLPDGASLVVTHIFECLLYGYGKRMKE